jgi:hypothetical protein
MTAVATQAVETSAKKGIDRGVMAVFAGLMLGSLIASLNMTLVAPAFPTIVSELGGLADYSWIPISAMLASTIVVPIAGKLSDIYGGKPLYMTGILVFAVGSALSGKFLRGPFLPPVGHHRPGFRHLRLRLVGKVVRLRLCLCRAPRSELVAVRSAPETQVRPGALPA